MLVIGNIKALEGLDYVIHFLDELSHSILTSRQLLDPVFESCHLVTYSHLRWNIVYFQLLLNSPHCLSYSNYSFELLVGLIVLLPIEHFFDGDFFRGLFIFSNYGCHYNSVSAAQTLVNLYCFPLMSNLHGLEENLQAINE